MGEVDLINRDPNGMNAHIQCAFEDVLAEPDAVHSPDCVWSLSYKCFNCGKNCCYSIMTMFCGICMACGWGCEYALLAFNHIWCLTPCMRDFSVTCGFWQKCFGVVINCCIRPVCEGVGSCLSQIKITKG